MSEAAERVEAWRRAKRKEGFRPVTLWLSLECKHELDSLAFKRHGDVSAVIIEAVHRMALGDGARTAPRLSEEDRRWLTDTIAQEVARQLGHPEVEAQAPREPPPRPRLPERRQTASPETLTRIRAAREQYPDATLAALAQHLFDAGIYRAKERRTGRAVPIDRHYLRDLLKRAEAQGSGA
jgi:hypothetical protein